LTDTFNQNNYKNQTNNDIIKKKFEVITLINTILGIYDDSVIRSKFFLCCSDYEFARLFLIPRISELSFQRAPIEADLYERLYTDLLKGCIMPPITVAIISNADVFSTITQITDAQDFIDKEISNCFILDGIQRLHTLNRVFQEKGNDIKLEKPLFINFIVSDSMDKLLYRMITLNNGQKPMSIRHQVEILADHMFDFEDFSLKVVSEKERNTGYKSRNKVDLKKASFVTAYLAYMSGSITIDNTKIVDELLNKLVAEQILSSGESLDQHEEFAKLVESISQWMYSSEMLKKWFKVDNNLIAFCAAARKQYGKISASSTQEILSDAETVESVFKVFDQSRIKLQTVRRKINMLYFTNYEKNRQMSPSAFLEIVMQEIN